ncbi:CHASE3 domain-containing protein [Nitrospira sp. NS4]|uniref:CHASE3 domain-containing protein n=1 Tax=Nitrospira sp. NS4 TaxID=3414498 RepID=UPI003C2E2F5B
MSRWQTAQDDRDRYVHIKQDLLRLERLVTDVDNGFRGYVLTKEGRFVKPMVAAESDIPSLVDRLGTMTGPWPDLHAHVEMLTGQVKELLETKRRLSMDLVLGREEDVLSYIRTGEGLELENIIVVAFQEVEYRMAQRDRKTMQDREDVRVWTHLILAVTTLGTLVIGMSMNRLATCLSEAIFAPRASICPK